MFAGIESAHVTSGSSLNTWLFKEARGTAPTNCTQVQVLPILVSAGSGGTIRFDDLSAFQPVTTFGWANFGPVFPGNGHTNQVFDPIGSNKQKFYRVGTQ
jgi:WD40 repeat protein